MPYKIEISGDASDEEVDDLVSQAQEDQLGMPGVHTITISANHLPSGVVEIDARE
jgi:hypothetical protein